MFVMLARSNDVLEHVQLQYHLDVAAPAESGYSAIHAPMCDPADLPRFHLGNTVPAMQRCFGFIMIDPPIEVGGRLCGLSWKTRNRMRLRDWLDVLLCSDYISERAVHLQVPQSSSRRGTGTHGQPATGAAWPNGCSAIGSHGRGEGQFVGAVGGGSQHAFAASRMVSHDCDHDGLLGLLSSNRFVCIGYAYLNSQKTYRPWISPGGGQSFG